MAKGKVYFNIDACKGCENCVTVCPKKILEIDKKNINAKGFHPISVTNMDECIACTNCALMCPDLVIKVEKLD